MMVQEEVVVRDHLLQDNSIVVMGSHGKEAETLQDHLVDLEEV